MRRETSSQPKIYMDKKDYIDYLLACSTEELKGEYMKYIKELEKTSQCKSAWVQDPRVFSEADCANTGEQRWILLGLMLIGICKNAWMCNKVRESQEDCLERFTAIVKKIEELFSAFIKGNGTTIAELAAETICFHVCREDPYGLNKRQLMNEPPPYLPNPRSEAYAALKRQRLDP